LGRSLTFIGQDGVKTYRAAALRSGLKLYISCGMKPNRVWNPTAMLRAAGQITGKRYKRGQYAKAVSDLGAWLANFGTMGGDLG
jgi:hypothetical protein